MKRLLIFGLLALVAQAVPPASAQCTLQNQAGCGGVYTLGGTPNPTLASFLSNVNSSLNAINAAIARVPQPKILLTAQILPAAGGFLRSSTQIFGPAIVPFMAALKAKAGVTVQDVNLFPPALSAASQYTGSIPSDCAGGVTIATNAALPTGTSPTSNCAMLVWYDGMFSYAAANGITLRVGVTQLAAQATACGLTPGSITETQYANCTIPFLKAMVTRWPAISAIQVNEEPTGGMQGIQVFSVADTAMFIIAASAAVKAIAPGMPVGAAYTGASWPSTYDTAYWIDAARGDTDAALPAALDFLVLDYFSGSCDQSAQYYYTETQWFATNFLAPSVNVHHKPVRVGQSDPPIWCPLAGLSYQPAAYLGQNDDIWRSSGLRVAWQDSIIRWASTAGISSWAVYCPVPFFYTTTNQSVDNCDVGNSSVLAMSHLGVTDAAASYQTLGSRTAGSIQGHAHMSGHVHIGH